MSFFVSENLKGIVTEDSILTEDEKLTITFDGLHLDLDIKKINFNKVKWKVEVYAPISESKKILGIANNNNCISKVYLSLNKKNILIVEGRISIHSLKVKKENLLKTLIIIDNIDSGDGNV
jgi:hypothetical protein